MKQSCFIARSKTSKKKENFEKYFFLFFFFLTEPFSWFHTKNIKMAANFEIYIIMPNAEIFHSGQSFSLKKRHTVTLE